MAFVDEVPTAVAGPMSDLMFAVLTIGNIPIGVMLVATAVVSLQTKAFPAWLGWLSAATAAAHLAAAFGIVASSGPLSPGGSVSYVAYALLVAWLLATTIVMIRRIGRPSAETAHLLANALYGEVHSRSSGLSSPSRASMGGAAHHIEVD